MRTVRLVLCGATLLGCLVAVASAQPVKATGKTKLVIDFSDASIFSSENDSPFECRSAHVSEGRRSLRVHYTNKPTWSNIWTQKFPKDWSGFRYLNLDVYLEGEANIAVFPYDNNTLVLQSFLEHGSRAKVHMSGDVTAITNLVSGEIQKRLYAKDDESVFEIAIPPQSQLAFSW